MTKSGNNAHAHTRMYIRAHTHTDFLFLIGHHSVKYKSFSHMQIFLILFFKKVYFVK